MLNRSDRRLSEAVRLRVPSEVAPGPGDLLGLELEFSVRSRPGAQVHFGSLIHRLGLDGTALDPGDPNAYRCSWGGVITADGAEAEIATPPVRTRPGFTDQLQAWARTGEAELRRAVPRGTGLDGYSAHFSAAMPAKLNDQVCRLYAATFAADLMLLMDRIDSPGLLVRPRPGRTELCGEFLEGEPLAAAAAFVAGTTRACAAAVRRPRGRTALPPRLDVRLARAVHRYGWYVDRRAFGTDLHAAGRRALLPRAAGGTICAQSHLELAWAAARRALADDATAADLQAAEAMVTGSLPLPAEHSHPDDAAGGQRSGEAGFCLEGAVVPDTPRPCAHVRPGFTLRPVAATWDFTVFEATGPARSAYACIPRDSLPGFVTALEQGALDDPIAAYLALTSRRRVLSAPGQTRRPGLYDQMDGPAGLLAPERDPQTGQQESGEQAAKRTLARPGKQNKQDQETPRKEQETPRQAPRFVPRAAAIGAAAAVLLAGVAVAAALLSRAHGPPNSSPSAPVSFQPSALVFPAVPVHASITRSVTVTNNGSSPATITRISLGGPGRHDFSVLPPALLNAARRGGQATTHPGAQPPPCHRVVPHAQTCTITVVFTPSAPRSRAADLRIYLTSSQQPQNIALSGTGTNAPPPPSVPPSSVSVTGVSPARGPTGGDTRVVITGSGFTGATGVSFGTAAAKFTVDSGTQVTATSPPGTGTVDITVTTPAGTSATAAADQYTYTTTATAAPAVTRVSPARGPTGGGTRVVITGSGFTGATGVSFGTAAAKFTVDSGTQVTATSPPGTGTVDITVTTPAGTSATAAADQYTYTTATAAPAVTRVSPARGPTGGGTRVVITGSGFTGATGVSFGTAAAKFTVDSGTQVTATSPPGTGTVDITVTTPAGTSATAAADQYTYTTATAAPAITSANTATFTAGTAGTFTVTTTGFPTASIKETGALPAGVTFAGNPDGTATLSGTPAPGTGGTYKLTISAANGVQPDATQSLTLTVNQPPAITSANTATFTAGTDTVGIAGTFRAGTARTVTAGTAGTFTVTTTGFPTASIKETGALPAGVTFAGNPDGTATLSGTPAPGTGGTYKLTISAANGVQPDATQSLTLTVNQPPAITSANTATFTAGTDTVGIAGTFRAGTARTVTAGTAGTFTVTTTGFPTASIKETGALPAGVTFAGNPDGTATLSGTPAPGTGGTYKLTISAANGVQPDATQSLTLTVNQAPAITKVSPARGPTGGDTRVVITGSGFTGATGVSFGTAAAKFTVDSGTQVTATSPPGTGTVDITVTTPAGTSATAAADQYTYTTTATAAPAVTRVSPARGPTGGGTRVVITGSGFTGATGVSFGTAAAKFTVDSGTQVTATSPPGTGTVDITVTTPAGTSATAAADQYTYTTATAAPAITSANTATFTAGTAGTFTVTTTGFPTASIKETGALPAGVTFAGNPDGTATLSGTPAPGTGGTYKLTISAANGVQPDATQSLTLTVNQPPAITSANTATFTAGTDTVGIAGTFRAGTARTVTAGTAGTFTVTTTGFPTASIKETGALPAGVTFAGNPDGTATLSGTPAPGTGGTYKLTISAANGVQPDATQSLTLTVNQPPAITSANTATFTAGTDTVGIAGTFRAGTARTVTAGTAGTFTVTTTGFPTASIKETGALPAGVTFAGNPDGTATLSGTPAPGTGGTYKLTISAANGVQPDATQSLTLTVNQPPAITSANTATFTAGTDTVGIAGTFRAGTARTVTAGTAGTFTVTTTGFPTASIKETGALPAGVTFAGNPDGTATLSGTPAPGTGGTYKLTISAANGVQPDATQSLTLTVNQAPAITKVSPARGPTGGDTRVVITGSGFTGATGVSFGTAAAKFTVDSGTQVTATSPPGTGTVDITVTTPAGTSATAAADQYTYTTATAAPAVTRVSPARGPTGGGTRVVITGSGFTGATGVSFGTAAAKFTVDSGTQVTATSPPGTGTVDITVTTPAGTSATAAADQYTYTTATAAPAVTRVSPARGPTGGGTRVVITGSGFTGATGVSFGTAAAKFTVDSGTQVTATSPPGTGTVDITVTTPAGTSATAAADQYTYTTATAAPAITSANTATFTAGTAGTFTVTTTGFPTASIKETGALPAGVTFAGNPDGTATLSGTPAPGTGGTYKLTISAANGVQPDATQSLTLTVNQPPAITSANTATFTAGTDTVGIAGTFRAGTARTVTAGTAGTFTVTTTGFPTASIKETGALPAGVTFAGNPDGTATLSGTPAPGTGGTYKLTISAANGVQPDATQSLTLTVNQPPAITSANTATFTAGTDTVGIAGTFRAGTARTVTAGTAGTFTVTTTGFPTASIKETGALPAGVTFAGNPDGTATLSGTPAPGTGGTYKLTISAANGVQPDATQSLTLTVNQPPAITSANTATFTAGTDTVGIAGTFRAGTARTVTAGTAGTFTVTTTGFPTASIKETGALPAGVTFAGNPDGTATLSGTPAPGTGGTYKLTISAANGVQPDATQSLTLTVNQAPAITKVSPARGPTGGDTRVVITGSGFTGATGVSFGTAAAKFTVDSGTQVTATNPPWTGTVHRTGSRTVHITVTTPAGTSAATAADQFTYYIPSPG